MDKKILHFQPTGLRIRECGDPDKREEESRTIEGCAIVFDTETILYEGGDWREIEIIRRSCVTDEFLKEQDIKLNLLHKRSQSFGRSNKGVGTLQMEIRKDGLYFSIEAPKCDLGEQALELVKNGTYTGCSFEFWPKDYAVSERTAADGKKEYVIEHTAFERIDALTIAMDPAYEDTSVSVRELYGETHKNVDDDADAAAQRVAEERAALQQRKAQVYAREADVLGMMYE